ncbi:MAG: CHAT domain-containing protein [Dolichospermum sp.]
MDEQRLQAYYQLIQQLLSCSNGEEAAILQANRELLDVGFLADFDTYLQFLSEVLQATAESRGNPQVVYPLLAANTDKLNLTFVELLQLLATNTLEEAEPDTAKSIAVVIGNFSNLIKQFPLGNKANNMEIAITGYEIVSTVFTRETSPEQWGTLQNNLGNAYSNRIRGDKAENLENAIAAYNAALEVYTRTDFPVDWAMTKNNLGNAYSNRIRGDKADNLEKAIAAYNAALEVYTIRAFPQDYVKTAYYISIAYRKLGCLISAYIFLETVISNLEIISHSDQIYLIYASIIEVCLELNECTLAIEYLEFSKNRNLLENIRKKVESDIEKEKSELIKKDKGSSVAKQDINLAKLKNLQKQREHLTKTRIGLIPMNFQEIQNLLDDKTAIIQFYIFNDCFRAFIITKNNDKPIIWKSTEEDLDQFRDWINKYLTLYYSDRNKWRNDLNYQLTKLAEIFHINQIIAQVPKHIQKIIIIPHRYLHLLPFHAIPLSTNSEYLFDKYPGGVSYAPSCQLLNIAKERLSNPILQRERTRLSNLFAIQDPNNNLRFTNIEVETIAASFDPQQILKNNEASKANLQKTTTFSNFTNSQWLHFSCHGSFDLESPLKSALQLADSEVNPSLLTTSSSRYARINEETAIDLSKCLTLADILELNLPQCYLVCLSACETGVIDFSNNSDEFIGLSSGFIKAGAVNIVSSLWNVEDFHTAILMIKLYENIANNPQDITLALNAAQQWLRQATQVEIIDWLKQKTEMEEEQKQEIINLLSTQYKPEHQPFNKPYFWAGFCAVSPVISPV